MLLSFIEHLQVNNSFKIASLYQTKRYYLYMLLISLKKVIIPIPYDYDFKATFKIVIGTKPPQSMPVQLHDRRSRSRK